MKISFNCFAALVLFASIDRHSLPLFHPVLAVETVENTLNVNAMIIEIENIERERTQALLERNYSYLEQLMADDCILIESNGTARTALEFIRAFKNSEFIFKEFTITENMVRIYNTTAVVTGKYNNIIIADGKENPRKFAAYTRIYVRDKDKWKLVSHQATEIK